MLTGILGAKAAEPRKHSVGMCPGLEDTEDSSARRRAQTYVVATKAEQKPNNLSDMVMKGHQRFFSLLFGGGDRVGVNTSHTKTKSKLKSCVRLWKRSRGQ